MNISRTKILAFLTLFFILSATTWEFKTMDNTEKKEHIRHVKCSQAYKNDARISEVEEACSMDSTVIHDHNILGFFGISCFMFAILTLLEFNDSMREIEKRKNSSQVVKYVSDSSNNSRSI
jgi:hypothetical protein